MSVSIWTDGYSRTLGDPQTDPWADTDAVVERVRVQVAAEPPRQPWQRRPRTGRPASIDWRTLILDAAARIEARGDRVSYSAVAREMGRPLPTIHAHCRALVTSGAWRWPDARTGGGRPKKGA